MSKRICRIFVLLLTLLFTVSCTDTNITTGDTDKRIFENLSYGEHARNTLDLVFPENATGDIGLVLFIHGGAWIAGSKEDYQNTLQPFCESTQQVCAAINYRYLSQQVSIDDILDDIDAALSTIRKTARERGLNITGVLLTGTSAGAHLSMLYAYRCKDTAPIRPTAVFSFCGPTDLSDESFYVNNALGTAQEICALMSQACGQNFTPQTINQAKNALDAVSPLTYVSSDICPTAICHGEKDGIVPYANALRILAAFEQHGVDYDFISFPNSGHELGNDPDCAQQANDLLLRYVQMYLQ